jgi:hypothetical protein
VNVIVMLIEPDVAGIAEKAQPTSPSVTPILPLTVSGACVFCATTIGSEAVLQAVMLHAFNETVTVPVLLKVVENVALFPTAGAPPGAVQEYPVTGVAGSIEAVHVTRSPVNGAEGAQLMPPRLGALAAAVTVMVNDCGGAHAEPVQALNVIVYVPSLLKVVA